MALGKKTGGRPKGVPNKKTAAFQEIVAKTGLTPIEVMLDNMRFAHDGAQKLLLKLVDAGIGTLDEKFDAYGEMLKLRGMAQEAAKDAAPYVHPRLAAIQHSGPEGGPVQVQIVKRVYGDGD